VHGLAFATRRGRGASPKLLAARLSSPPGSIAGMNSGQFSAIASVIISIAMIALTVIAIPIALQLRRSYNKFNKLLDRLNEDAGPLIRHATATAENVEYITTTIRSDVQRINATLNDANERVQHAVRLTENRLHEFSALLSVVQDEAEHLFVSTASAVHGVREGATALTARGGMDLASDADDEIDDPDLAESESLENDHGDRSDPDGSAQASPAPRVRSRAPQRRAGGGV
jgi:uncharacterized protein YoxC